VFLDQSLQFTDLSIQLIGTLGEFHPASAGHDQEACTGGCEDPDEHGESSVGVQVEVEVEVTS
tara:strand:- start:274 stop:462 length:189 start_codon:yes stop_codon:yes gene_type:complete